MDSSHYNQNRKSALSPVGWLCVLFGLVGCLTVMNATWNLDTPYRHLAGQALWLIPAVAALLFFTKCPRKWLTKIMFIGGALLWLALWFSIFHGVQTEIEFPFFEFQGFNLRIPQLAAPFFAFSTAWILAKTDLKQEQKPVFYTIIPAIWLFAWILPMLIKPVPGMVFTYACAFAVCIACSSSRTTKPTITLVLIAMLFTVFAHICAAPLELPRQQLERALASGGFWGQSLGQSTWALYTIPFPNQCSIIATFGESIGLLGLASLVLAVTAWVVHGYKTSGIQTDPMQRYAIIALVSIPAIQFFAHLAVILGLIPPMRIPLPILDTNGSTTIATFAIVGIVENIRKNNIQPMS